MTHLFLLAPAAAFVCLGMFAFGAWRREKRLQFLEHEVATMHANGAPGPGPTTPEVSRRYAQMKVED